MFAPTKVYRKWHVKVNQNQKRFAVASAIAASAIPSLVLARGHRIEELAECPLVVGDDVQALKKTKEAVAFLKEHKAHRDVLKVTASKKVRAGKGKLRNRRFTQRRGPLVIYDKDEGLVKAFRNIPGVEVANVRTLNLLQLAPGGHLGRFCIWTQSAFSLLDSIWSPEMKSGYVLPQHIMANSDVTRLINSDEIQSVLKAKGNPLVKRTMVQKKNPLKNKAVALRLNPYTKAFAGSEHKKLDEGKGKQDLKKFLPTLFSD
jgi:large subunit ribosomal protein L4e